MARLSARSGRRCRYGIRVTIRNQRWLIRSDLADLLAQHVRAVHLPPCEREYRAIPDRKFRTDLAWPDRKLWVEVDGGEFMDGRHSRGLGMIADCEKHARLTLLGWTGFRFVGTQVRNGFALWCLEQWFKGHP